MCRATSPCLLAAALLAVASAAAPAQDAAPKGKPRFFFENGPPPAPPVEAQPPATAPPAAPAQPTFAFETPADLPPWQALDQEAVVDLDTEPGAALSGHGCLRMTYVAREGSYEQLTAEPLTVTGATTLAFAIKTDFPTNLSFGVVERGGAFYQQFAAIPADAWTRISLPLSSLVLSQDTQDQTGRLEPDSIIELRFADLANLYGALGDALGHKIGVQRLFLDDVTLSATPPEAGQTPPLLVDSFERDAVYALAIGEAQLRRVPDGDGHALEARSEDRTGRWKGFVTAVGQLDLRAADTLTLRARASEPLILNVTLEERDGSKYSQRVGLDGAGAWVEKSVPLDALVLETDSDDENGRLDRDQLRVLVIVADMARPTQLPVSFTVDDIAFR